MYRNRIYKSILNEDIFIIYLHDSDNPELFKGIIIYPTLECSFSLQRNKVVLAQESDVENLSAVLNQHLYLSEINGIKSFWVKTEKFYSCIASDDKTMLSKQVSRIHIENNLKTGADIFFTKADASDFFRENSGDV